MNVIMRGRAQQCKQLIAYKRFTAFSCSLLISQSLYPRVAYRPTDFKMFPTVSRWRPFALRHHQSIRSCTFKQLAIC